MHRTHALLVGAASLLCLAGAAGAAQQVAIPSYFYPGPLWTQMENAYPTVGLAIINPNSGPGASLDPNYVTQTTHTKATGIRVLGYVYTSYGTRAAAAVEADVDAYYAWYGVDGIFFDEVSNNCTMQSYYATLDSYVKAKGGLAITVLNPGTTTPQCYITAADILLTFEDTFASYQGYTPMGWESGYPASHFWHLIHTTAAADMVTAVNLSKSRNAGWVYVTPDVMPNPWDTLPPDSYWSAELNAVRGTTTSGGIPALPGWALAAMMALMLPLAALALKRK